MLNLLLKKDNKYLKVNLIKFQENHLDLGSYYLEELITYIKIKLRNKFFNTLNLLFKETNIKVILIRRLFCIKSKIN